MLLVNYIGNGGIKIYIREKQFTFKHSVHSISLCCSMYCLCVNVYWTTATGISGHFSTNLRFFRAFSCCKTNARVYNLQRRGTASSSQFFFFFLLLRMFRSLYSAYRLCVNVYCTTATWCQPNCS
jgi:hypothetical protein